MTQNFATIAAFRYGLGFAPGQPDVSTIDALVNSVRGPDTLVEMDPAVPFAERMALLKEYQQLQKLNKARDPSLDKQRFREVRNAQRGLRQGDVVRVFLRGVESPASFRERLAFFWTDHFTVSPKSRVGNHIWGDHVEQGIRPHIGGSFGDLLISAVTHPSMLLYLDQVKSVGPNSDFGQRKRRGLNENLAREILELHTMGVGGSYSQTDVRQLAELLTGLFIRPEGRGFIAKRAEPGAETVLGKTYGDNVGKAQLGDIDAFLRDVAIHPDTAAHIAFKLVKYFVSDEPDAGHVASVARVFLETDGDLPSVYGALLDHPLAWQPLGLKAKKPLDYMISGLRALGMTGTLLRRMRLKDAQRELTLPLVAMGQPIRRAPGPNGWPEEAEAWITPQGLAARLQWSLLTAQRIGRGKDPREFVDFALRELAGERLRFAVSGAEIRTEGLALVLASPEFNRR